METDNQIVVIASLLEGESKNDIVENLRDLYNACHGLSRDLIESRIYAIGNENVFRLKRLRETIVAKKNQFMLLREEILQDLPSKLDFDYPDICPGQQTVLNYRGIPGYYARLLDALKAGEIEDGRIVSCPDPFHDGDYIETTDQDELIRTLERYFDEFYPDSNEYTEQSVLYTFKEDVVEMLSEVSEKVDMINSVIREFLREIPTREGLLFSVAIDKWAPDVYTALFDENDLRVDEFLQFLNLNPRYSKMNIRKSRQSWIHAFIYVLFNFYEDFGGQDRWSWEKGIVAQAGLNWGQYIKHKKDVDDTGSVGMNKFISNLLSHLQRYNLLKTRGVDGTDFEDYRGRVERKLR